MLKFKPLGEMGTRPEVSPTAITDIIDRYVQDGRSPQTAFLWAIAETAPDVMDKATSAAIKAGNTAAAGADLRADLLGIEADSHEKIVAIAREYRNDDGMKRIEDRYREQAKHINDTFMLDVKNGSTPEAYELGHSMEAFRSRLARPAQWLATVATTVVAGGTTALGLGMLSHQGGMTPETQRNITLAAPIPASFIAGALTFPIVASRKNTGRFARAAARRKLDLK